jgi:hypothetical protein
MPTTVTLTHTANNAELADRLRFRITCLESGLSGVFAQKSSSLENLRSLAREGARYEGERVVLDEVLRTIDYHEDTLLTVDRILWAVIYGASIVPPSSNIDAESFAEGQRNALSWVRHNVRANEYE